MGIYDRDYNRDHYPQSGFQLGTATLTTKLIILMFVVYGIQIVTRGPREPDDGWFTNLFSLNADAIKRPWLLFQLVTYGFLHNPWSVLHIIFNTITLWFFGRTIEARYGPREYLAFFLISIIAAGTVWMIGQYVANGGFSLVQLLGASGGVSAVLFLFCLNYPREMIYIWGVLPIPAWIFAIVFVAQDLLGAFGRPLDGNNAIAFTAHLGGALFAFIYFKAGWRLERLLPGSNFRKLLKPRPKLRVLDPDEIDDSTEAKVDEILQKIQEKGRDSLTRGERRILEEASKQYQKRRK